MEETHQDDDHVGELLQLPEFEGVIPIGVVTKINGAGSRIVRPLGLGARVVLVVEAEVRGVDHKETKDGVKRVHTLAVADLFEVEGKDGKKLLSSARLRHKKADDNRKGMLAIPSVDEQAEGIEVTVDENGIALTPEEVKAARGESIVDENAPETVTLVFDDGTRAVWPDDFAAPNLDDDPMAGDRVLDPHGSGKDLLIRQVLDIESGEVIEEWTDANEAARLEEEEAHLAAQEASAATPAEPELPEGEDA